MLTLAAALSAVPSASCKSEPQIEERAIVIYSPRSCPVSETEAFSVIYANGDFADSQSAVASLYLRDVGAPLSELPEATRAVIVDVSHPAKSIDWRGTTEVPSSGPVNVLVWPGGETCRLTRNVEARTDMALGVFGRHVMIAGGRIEGQVPPTFVGDLTTGIVESLRFGLRARRLRPTITAFRASPSQDLSPALVAGGEDPDRGTPLDTAEVYEPNPDVTGGVGDFSRDPIVLLQPRAKHAAVVLPSEETLLVGGIGGDGAPQGTMEIVDPATRRSRLADLLLLVPRVNPTVIRLTNGELLVAGGVDRENKPVPTLEWLSPDVRRRPRRPTDLVTGRDRAFVALGGGGALAVILPNAGVTDFKTVWIISADGTLEPGLSVDPSEIETLQLFPGADGAPVLWTGRRWLRWQPWSSAFVPLADAPSTTPATRPSMVATASGDSGLALWLDSALEGQLYVTGLRFAARSRFGNLRNPLLVESPFGLAPDRVAGTPESSIRFEQGRGLTLGPGASAFVTDLTYANVSVEIDGDGAPTIVLRQEDGQELVVGGAACPFAQRAERTLYVERAGQRVRVRIDDGDVRECPTLLSEGTRISIGVRGSEGASPSIARNLRVQRR